MFSFFYQKTRSLLLTGDPSRSFWRSGLEINADIVVNLKNSFNSCHFATSGSPVALFSSEISPSDPKIHFWGGESEKSSEIRSLPSYCRPDLCDTERRGREGIAYSSSWMRKVLTFGVRLSARDIGQSTGFQYPGRHWSTKLTLFRKGNFLFQPLDQ